MSEKLFTCFFSDYAPTYDSFLSFYLFYFLIDNDQHAQTHIDKMLTSAKFASLRFIANIIIEMLKLMPKIFADAAARRPVA